MLEFGPMKVEGFASILDEGFDWGMQGLNVIHAPNGTGKSKFVNALTWGLFGKPLSGSVEMWDHLQPEDYQGVKVEVWFTKDEVDYQVIRCKNYKGIVRGAKGKNRLIIVEDGEELDFDDKGETKQELENILGYSYELFKNTIIFGQKLKRLVNETGPKKKQILDEAFEVMYIAKANKLVQNKQKEKSTELDKAENELTITQTKYNSADENLTREKVRVANQDKVKEEELSELREKRRGIRAELRELKKQRTTIEGTIEPCNTFKAEIKGLEKKYEKYYEHQTELAKQSTLKGISEKGAVKIQKDINTLKAKLGRVPTHCSNCNKPFTKGERAEELLRIQESIDNLTKGYHKEIATISNIKTAIQAAKLSMSSLNSTKESIDSKKKSIKILEDDIKRLPMLGKLIKAKESVRDECTDKIAEIKENPPKNYIEKFTRTLSALEKELKEKTKTRDLIKREYEDLIWLTKDPLSNAGLKAYIFDQMLDSINDRLEYYKKFSGLSIGFTIDMDSTRKDLMTWIAQGGYYVNYDELSGGQQQKVDIVIIFAVHDVVSDSKDCSLMVMDELFESLDQENINILTELIMEKAKEKCLYLITHRSEFSPRNANIISLANVNGFTRII